jgi:hypothetical protein
VQDDGMTRREEQHDVFVTTGGGGDSSTFVRREEHTTVTTTTTTSGELNDNEGGGSGLKFTATVGTDEYESAPITISPIPPATSETQPEPVMAPLTVDVAHSSMTTSLSLSPGATLISSSAASPSYSSKPAPPPVSPKPARSPGSSVGGVPRGPTFKAQPPRVAPEVAPKPVVVGGQVVTSDPLLSPKPQFQIRPTFNAKAVAQVVQTQFQVQATAMYSHQPHSPQPYSPPSRGPPAFKQQQQQQQQSYQSPVHSSPQQPAFSKQTSRQISSSSTTVSSKQQMFLPISVQTPDSAPYSPSSPGVYSMFNVRNNVGEGKVVWTPNMWLPGQEPAGPSNNKQQQSHQRQQDVANNNHGELNEVEVPRHLSIKERQQQLLHHASRTKHSLSARQNDPTFDAPPEHVQREMQRHHHHHGHLPVFAPPVEIALDERMDSDSGSASPTSSILRKSE